MTSTVEHSLRTGVIGAVPVGWYADAEAVARVLVEDAALDATNPGAGTVFDGAADVTFMGQSYRVLAVRPIGSSFRLAVSYYVWLKGSTKQ
jgi:hypothetical protein